MPDRSAFTLADLEAVLSAPPTPRVRGVIFTPAQLAEARAEGFVRDATDAERATYPECCGWLSGWGFEEPVYLTKAIKVPDAR